MFKPRASRRMASTSSSFSRILRPLPSPSNGIDVRPGHAMQIASPIPELLTIICRCRPLPNAPRRLTETVPQTMPNIVRNVRSFWLRRSVHIWRRASRRESMSGAPDLVDCGRQLLGRPLEDLRSEREALGDLDVQPVGDPELDGGLLGGLLGLGRGQLDERLLAAVLEDDDSLRDCQHVLLLANDQVRVGRVAGAQRYLRAGIELDLDVEERGAFLLLGLRRDARDLPGHDVG